MTLRNDWADGAERLPASAGSIPVIIAPDEALFDGRFADNGWLQELPQRLSKLTWDNAAYLSRRPRCACGWRPASRKPSVPTARRLN